MDITGQERINAPRDIVWAALNDPEVLKRCIPGCRTLDWTSRQTLVAAVKIKIGPLWVTFHGDISLSNMKPPESYTISAQGSGGIAGLARGGADVLLIEDDGETILQYAARAEVGGKLAQLGARFVDPTSGKIAQHFFADFNAAVTGMAAN